MTYTIQPGTINGRDWYLSSNGRAAIWWGVDRTWTDGSWKWFVGKEYNKGTAKADIKGGPEDYCPISATKSGGYFFVKYGIQEAAVRAA